MHLLGNWLLAPGAEFTDGCRNHIQAAPPRETSSRSMARWSTVVACSTSRWRTCARARFPRTMAGRAALAGERAAVAAASRGRRNATLNRAAFNLGQLVAVGLLEADQVRAVLAAALEAGQPEAKARTTIESGLRGGGARPRRRRDGAA